MENVTTLGVDLAKNDFQVCGMNSKGKVLFNRKYSRKKFLEFVLNLKISEDFHVAMEACGGANHWGRLLQSSGFEVKVIAPQFVKPYVKSHKNDHNDAEAIAEASRRPTMRFVGVKSETQQEINAIHNISGNLVKRMPTALTGDSLKCKLSKISSLYFQTYFQSFQFEAFELYPPRRQIKRSKILWTILVDEFV